MQLYITISDFPERKSNKILYFPLFSLQVPNNFKPQSTRSPLTKELNFIDQMGQMDLLCLIFLLHFHCRKHLSWSYTDLENKRKRINR